MANNTFTTNRRARFDYEIVDKFTAGIVLEGHEVKSIRSHGASLNGAYVTISDNKEAWLTNAHIKLYEHASTITNYDPERARKLLLNKSEIQQLIKARDNKYVIVPLSLFAGGPNIKVEIATAKPRKQFDKRHNIKRRDTEREELRKFKK